MLNLIPQRAISNVPKLVLLIKKVKQIVTFFKHSITAADMLTKCQHGGCILKLKQEVPTRWNTTYYMMERFKILAPKISSVLLEIPNGPEMLSTAELNDIKDLLHLLQPFEIVTKEVSGQEYITSSKVIPLVHTLENKVGNLEATTEIGQKLQIELKKEIEKRFQKIEFIQLLSIATLIDPRFKTIHFQKPLAKSNVLQIVNKEIRQMISAENVYVSNSRLNSEENVNDNLVDNNSDIWNYHKKVKYLASSQILESSNSTMEAEFKQYLYLPLININNDVLAVWESYKTVFPHLYVVAQKYLSTVSSSVPSERLFSKAGNLITEKRNRISESRISKLCFLQTIPAMYWDL
ncbi:zinc finger BED domain-containing protein 1-like [Sipha flava]|uniref:Zinc finger BED domain-containing protein 1-like n=1 Tax=Sipha flava TaxID=143950 RepID=A0A8B8GFV1_9HEMI|nr:zinc finger BED domain-containing protein 1-like [Sipha flava]